eukprot:tig00021137_g18974.t1
MLRKLLAWCPRGTTALVALERRVNFSVDTLSPASPAYDFFRSCFELAEDGVPWRLGPGPWSPPSRGGPAEHGAGAGARLMGRRFDVGGLPRRFSYERTPQLEIFEVASV